MLPQSLCRPRYCWLFLLFMCSNLAPVLVRCCLEALAGHTFRSSFADEQTAEGFTGVGHTQQLMEWSDTLSRKQIIDCLWTQTKVDYGSNNVVRRTAKCHTHRFPNWKLNLLLCLLSYPLQYLQILWTVSDPAHHLIWKVLKEREGYRK